MCENRECGSTEIERCCSGLLLKSRQKCQPNDVGKIFCMSVTNFGDIFVLHQASSTQMLPAVDKVDKNTKSESKMFEYGRSY